MSLPSPDPAPLLPAAAFLKGMRTALTSVFILVTVGTFLGVGALAHDLGFSIVWTLVGAVLLWAAPAQVIIMTALAGGSPWIEIAIAVTLSGVRLLPMTVSLVPLLRGPGTTLRHLIVTSHFVAVTIWALGLAMLPAIPRESRVQFVNGMGAGFATAAVGSSLVGYYLAAGLPVTLAAALLFVTPLSFLIMTAGNARTLADRLALVLGLVIAPILVLYQAPFDLMWSGVIAGTLGYGAQRLYRALKPEASA